MVFGAESVVLVRSDELRVKVSCSRSLSQSGKVRAPSASLDRPPDIHLHSRSVSRVRSSREDVDTQYAAPPDDKPK